MKKEFEDLNEKYGCFITLSDFDSSLGKRLSDYFVIVKDNISTRGIRTTAGSQALHDYTPPYDATVISKIKREGARIVGKSSMDEFGLGTFSTNTKLSIPKNPHDTNRTCGGSSGGVASFVSAFKGKSLGLGTSTGGSISCPASFCGVVGLTPTYGLVSRYGLIDYSNSMDKIGCISKNVEDSALVLSIIAGYDEKDSTSVELENKDYTKYCIDGVKGLRIGVPKEYLEHSDEKVVEVFKKSISDLENKGALIKEVSLPSTKLALPAYYILAMSEVSTNLARYCGMRYGAQEDLSENYNEYFSSIRNKIFCEETKRRILLGTFVRMAGYRDKYYLKALKIRTKVIDDFKKVFQDVDVIASPTMPVVAPKFSDIEKMSPSEMYAMDILTCPSNLAGFPQLSIPCGFIEKMPVGLQLISNYFCEDKIIKVGYSYERTKR